MRIARDDFEGGTVASVGDVAFIGGERSDRAVVIRWRQGDAETVFEHDGWIEAFCATAGRVWAITADHGREPRYVLFRADGGGPWTEVGPVPLESVSGVTARGETVWAHGVRGLVRSRDGGVSWSEVAMPFAPGVDTRVTAGADRLVVYGPGWASSRDDGDSWRVASTDAGISAADGDWVAARRDDGVSLGRITDGRIDWVGDLGRDGRPEALAVRGPQIRLLMVPRPMSGLEAWKGWVELSSTEGSEGLRAAPQTRVPGDLSPLGRPVVLTSFDRGFALGRERGTLQVLK